jgi:transcriptional regulator
MYRPPAFREDRPEILQALIEGHRLGTLVTHSAAGLEANLVPFTADWAAGPHGMLKAHLAKANSQHAALASGAETLVIFQGPETYITPSWYPSKAEHGKVVPTWNYVVVEVRGPARIVDDATWLRAQIAELTATQEAVREHPWTVDDAPTGYIVSQLKGIFGIEIPRAHRGQMEDQPEPAGGRPGGRRGRAERRGDRRHGGGGQPPLGRLP